VNKKISKTMMFSMIGVLAIVFLAPLSFAGAQYLNDQEVDTHPGVYKTYDTLAEYSDANRAYLNDVTSKNAINIKDYNATNTTDINALTSVVYGDGELNQALIERLYVDGPYATRSQSFYFQINMSASKAMSAGITEVELVLKVGAINMTDFAPNGQPSEYTLYTDSGATGTGFIWTEDTSFLMSQDDLTPSNWVDGAWTEGSVDAEGYLHVYYQLSPTYVLTSAFDSADATEDVTFLVGIAGPAGVNLDGEIMEWTINSRSADVNPYTLMDTVAMILGGVFIVGAVFATPFVSTKGIRRR